VSVSFPNVDAVRERSWAGLAVAGLALALLLGACGDDDDPAQTTAPAVTGAADTTDAEKAPGTEAPEDEVSDDPASDRTAISMTLDAVLTGTDPRQVCGELVTERYLRDAYGGGGGCEAAQSDAKPAKTVRISRVVVLPDSVAQASARPSGGLYDGDQLRAELVLDGGFWKLDSLSSNVPVGP
jgi:hypothetical protein